MPQSYNKIWIHSVWSTKNREPLIAPKYEQIIFDYMRSKFKELGCPVRIINGMSDHVHCLFLLNPNRSMADVIKNVKGSTSYFVNNILKLKIKFAWQDGYGSFSIGESSVNRTFEYIENQKTKHSKQSYYQEMEKFIQLHDL